MSRATGYLWAALVLAPAFVQGLPQTMRAVVEFAQGISKGDYSHVLVENFAVPEIGPEQVLIHVHASSVNPVDWKDLSDPFITYPHVLGRDVAGTVAAVGAGCQRLKVGDEVWADLEKVESTGPQMGAWAEYAVADESQVGLKPKSLNWLSAAALPLVSMTDIQALRKAGAPWKKENLTAIVTSGSGGTGVSAIQLARALGAANIFTAASPSNQELLKSLGADLVVDYHTTSLWTVLPENSVDIVYDNYGAPGTADLAMKVLRPGGVFIFLPGRGGDLSKHPKEGVTQINYGSCDPSKYQDLDAIAAIVDAGKLKAVVSQVFPLEDFGKAFNASLTNHAVGKIGIQVSKQLSVMV